MFKEQRNVLIIKEKSLLRSCKAGVAISFKPFNRSLNLPKCRLKLILCLGFDKLTATAKREIAMLTVFAHNDSFLFF